MNLHLQTERDIYDGLHQELKAAIAYAIEKRATGRFRRTVTGSAKVEKRFRDESFPLEEATVEAAPVRAEEIPDDR